VQLLVIASLHLVLQAEYTQVTCNTIYKLLLN